MDAKNIYILILLQQLKMVHTILSLPPTSHDVKLMFLYSIVSTLKPVVRKTIIYILIM